MYDFLNDFTTNNGLGHQDGKTENLRRQYYIRIDNIYIYI